MKTKEEITEELKRLHREEDRAIREYANGEIDLDEYHLRLALRSGKINALEWVLGVLN